MFINKIISNLSNQFKIKERRITKGRELVTSLYLKGSGIEIGALHDPLVVDRTVKIKYVDRMSNEDLRKQYPELNHLKLVEVDIIDDGEKLENIKDESQDFVIANHFMEHCQNPLLALKNMERVVKKGGILYLAVPDKRHTFDVDRPVTPFEHLEKDYLEGSEQSKKQHFAEWVRLVNKTQGEERIGEEVKKLMKMDYSIHYHVWTQVEILELLSKIKKYSPSLEVEMLYRNEKEIIFILSKVF